MFDDREYEMLSEIHHQCLQTIQIYRQAHQVTLEEVPLSQLYQPFIDLYFQLAQVPLVFEVDEVMRRHYLLRWRDYHNEVEENLAHQVLLEFPDEGIKQSMTVVTLSADTYRIEDVAGSLLGYVKYRDVIKANELSEGHLVFRRIVEPASWQTNVFLLPRKVVDSKQLQRILDEVKEHGGYSEFIMGGNLVVALPPNSQIDVSKKLSNLVTDNA